MLKRVPIYQANNDSFLAIQGFDGEADPQATLGDTTPSTPGPTRTYSGAHLSELNHRIGSTELVKCHP